MSRSVVVKEKIKIVSRDYEIEIMFNGRNYI